MSIPQGIPNFPPSRLKLLFSLSIEAMGVADTERVSGQLVMKIRGYKVPHSDNMFNTEMARVPMRKVHQVVVT